VHVLRQHLVDLRAAAHHRVERGHRLLEHHGHAHGAAQRAQMRGVGREHVLALHAMRPPEGTSAGGSRPITAWAITDLPEPDSPSRHTTWPGITSKEMS
jgi:hypothetical protein